MTAPSIHDTFRSIASKQEFDLSDIISELTKSRDRYLSWADGAAAKFKDIVTKQDFARHGENEHCIKSLANAELYHNALVVALQLQASGETTVLLNPKKSLPEQMILKGQGEEFKRSHCYIQAQRNLGQAPA